MVIDHITKEDLNKFKKELLREIVRITNGEAALIEEDTGEKILIKISVAQISVIIRALMDVGIIVNRNKTEVIRSLVQNVRTDQAEKISMESLRMKMYTVESGTKEQVKNLLMDLFKIVHKY